MIAHHFVHRLVTSHGHHAEPCCPTHTNTTLSIQAAPHQETPQRTSASQQEAQVFSNVALVNGAHRLLAPTERSGSPVHDARFLRLRPEVCETWQLS